MKPEVSNDHEAIRYALNPDFVCRVAGLAVDSLLPLRSKRLPDILGEIAANAVVLASTREEVSAELFARIGHLSATERGSAIALRRALYSGRRPKEALLVAARLLVNTTVFAAIDRQLTLQDAQDQLDESYATVFRQELSRTRQHLRILASDGDFRMAVGLSSEVLSETIDRAITASLETVNAKSEQTERGVLRYLTRMALKPSPYARFCAVIGGVVVDGSDRAERPFEIVGGLDMVSHIRLNRAIFPLLWKQLIQNPLIRASLAIAVNPSLRCIGDELVFMSESGGREAYRRLKQSDSLSMVLAIIAGPSLPTYGDLVHELMRASDAEDSGEARESMHSYVNRLLDVGLLSFVHGISPMDADWDRPLEILLSKIDDPHASATANALRQMRELVDSIGKSDHRIRKSKLERLRALVTSTVHELGGIALLPGGSVCYDDASADATAFMRMVDVGHPFEQLGALHRILDPIGRQHDNQAELRAVFDQCYGTDREEVPLLEFYEDSFRAHFKRHFALERNPAQLRKQMGQGYNFPNPLNLPSISHRQNIRRALAGLIRSRLGSNMRVEEVSISLEEIQAIVPRSLPCSSEPASLSAFCQLIHSADTAKQKLLLICPDAKVLPGFGKYFSRFLHLLPYQVARRLRETNRRSAEEVLAEIADDADFNANLHPPLTDTEIEYPTRPGEVSAGDRLSCADLLVRRGTENESLWLVDRRSQRRIWPMDVGFLNPTMRPALYRLLSRFQPVSHNGLPIEESLVEWHARADSSSDTPVPDRVTYSPRIVVGDNLIVARRRWRIPGTIVPRLRAGESQSDFFRRVHFWRIEEGIPPRVFIRIVPIGQRVTEKPEQLTETAAEIGESVPAERVPTPQVPTPPRIRDEHKPQYIDFESPLLVLLFARLGSNVSSLAMLAEECLPDLEDGWSSSASPRITELIVQLDRRPSLLRVSVAEPTYGTGIRHA